MREWLEENEERGVTFYFKVRGKNMDNEIRHQSSLSEKETLAGNYYISRKVALREHGEFKYCFKKSILSKS